MPNPHPKPPSNPKGRPKGSHNKRSLAVADRIRALGGDYTAYLVATMNNKIPCATCRGKGRTPFQPGNGSDEPSNRKCQSCWGSKLEKIPPKESAWAAAELMQYCEAKRKAIEVSGSLGTPDLAAVLRERFARRGDTN